MKGLTWRSPDKRRGRGRSQASSLSMWWRSEQSAPAGGDNGTSLLSNKKTQKTIYLIYWFVLHRNLSVIGWLRHFGCKNSSSWSWWNGGVWCTADRISVWPCSQSVCEGKQDITLAPAARRITILELLCAQCNRQQTNTARR